MFFSNKIPEREPGYGWDISGWVDKGSIGSTTGMRGWPSKHNWASLGVRNHFSFATELGKTGSLILLLEAIFLADSKAFFAISRHSSDDGICPESWGSGYGMRDQVPGVNETSFRVIGPSPLVKELKRCFHSPVLRVKTRLLVSEWKGWLNMICGCKGMVEHSRSKRTNSSVLQQSESIKGWNSQSLTSVFCQLLCHLT